MSCSQEVYVLVAPDRLKNMKTKIKDYKRNRDKKDGPYS